METGLRNQMEEREYLVRKDAEYLRLLEQCIDLEDAWLEVMDTILAEKAETISRFLCACMELSERKINMILESMEK